MILSFVVWVIILAPIVMLLARFRLSADATKLNAGFRRWRLGKHTGNVVSYSSYTSVHGSGGYSVGNTIAPISVGTDLHERIRLELPGGKQWDVELENFGLSPDIGDIVTIWLGARRGSERIFAALNHTSEAVKVSAQEIFAMGSGGKLSQSLKVLSMIFFLVFCVFVGILAGQVAIVLWGFVPFSVWLLRSRRISNFARMGTRPLWNAATPDAQALMRLSPPAAG
jgi:hypothetical protein